MSRPELLTKALDVLYEELWTEPNESDLPDPKVFGPILSKVLGEEVVRENLERMGTPEVKGQLVKNTDQALNEGAFGLPWFQCENGRGEKEGFWGFDHLGQVVRFLELDCKGEVRAML